MSPNFKELLLIFKTCLESDKNLTSAEKSHLAGSSSIDNPNGHGEIENLKIMLKYLLKFVPYIMVSRGENDLVLASRHALDLTGPNKMPRRGLDASVVNDKPHLYLFPTLKLDESRESIRNVSGAGDSSLAGLVAGILKGWPLVDSIYNGLLAAKLSIQTNESISDKLGLISPTQIEEAVRQNSKQIKIIRLLDCK